MTLINVSLKDWKYTILLFNFFITAINSSVLKISSEKKLNYIVKYIVFYYIKPRWLGVNEYIWQYNIRVCSWLYKMKKNREKICLN